MTDAFLGQALQTILRANKPPQRDLSHYQDGVLTAYDAVKNLAFTQACATVNPLLSAHSQRMAQRIYCVADRVYCAVGYALANVIFVVGDSGVVVADCTESLEAGQAALADFYHACPAAASLPIVAVIYTHNHSDHIGGVRAFSTPEAVAAGLCQIVAHSTLMQAVAHNASVIAPILAARSAYSFGALLETGPNGSVNGGIGPVLARGKSTFIAPTLTFDDALDVTLAGVRFAFRHAPSETDDELIAYLPDLGVLLSAEVIQGECLANVHTLRGTRYRDPQQWVRTIDAMRAHHAAQPAQFLVPAHGRPVGGASNIDELLTSYRDAIAFIHDQAVRLMNQGARPDELADLLPSLPAHLVEHAWLGEYYGTVKHCVRQVFAGELGWFDGDPATLDPLPPRERAARWLALIGGAQAALAAAHAALPSEPRWAAEVATTVLRGEFEDQSAIAAAKLCKAQAFEALGFATENINWRNWYLTAARELRGAYDALQVGQGGGALANDDIIASLKPAQLLGLLAVRVAAERCFEAHHWLGFDITQGATSARITLELRRGVFQVHEAAVATMPSDAPVLRMDHAALLGLLRDGASALMPMMQAGQAQLTSGSPLQIAAFFSCFDVKATRLPKLASR